MSRKLFIISFCIAFVFTAFLCIVSEQPLLLGHKDYSINAFIPFGLMIAVLCFLLVYINLPVLKFFKNIILKEVREEGYYIIGTFIILQIVTLITGYAESSLNRHEEASMFFYYKGITNSHIYILTGNITAVIAASLYAKEQSKLKKEANTKFEFDSLGK